MMSQVKAYAESLKEMKPAEKPRTKSQVEKFISGQAKESPPQTTRTRRNTRAVDDYEAQYPETTEE